MSKLINELLENYYRTLITENLEELEEAEKEILQKAKEIQERKINIMSKKEQLERLERLQEEKELLSWQDKQAKVKARGDLRRLYDKWINEHKDIWNNGAVGFDEWLEKYSTNDR